MASTKTYRQCKMRTVDRPVFVTTGWIEERGAKVGAQVELLPQGTFWEVVEVYEHPIPGDILAETQRQRRQGMPSLRDTDKDKRQREMS